VVSVVICDHFPDRMIQEEMSSSNCGSQDDACGRFLNNILFCRGLGSSREFLHPRYCPIKKFPYQRNDYTMQH
jgi:hypothetical protein